MSAMVALVDHCFCGNPLNLTHDDDEEPSIYCSTQCARQDALDSLSGSGPLHPSSAPPSLTSSASFSSLSSCQSLPSEHNDYNTNADYEVDDLDIPDDEDGVWEFLTPVPAQTLHSDSFVSHYRRVQAQNVPQLPSFEAANFAALTNLSPASPSTTPSQFQSSQARSGAVDVVLESGERFAGSRDSLYSLPEDDECIVDRSRTPRSWGREAATTPLPPFPSNVVWPTTNDNVHFVSRLPVRKERARRHSSVYDYGTVLSRPPGLPLFSKYADSEHDEKDYQSGHSSDNSTSVPLGSNTEGNVCDVADVSSEDDLPVSASPLESLLTPPVKSIEIQQCPSATTPGIPSQHVRHALAPIDTRAANFLTQAARSNQVLEVSPLSPAESPDVSSTMGHLNTPPLSTASSATSSFIGPVSPTALSSPSLPSFLAKPWSLLSPKAAGKQKALFRFGLRDQRVLSEAVESDAKQEKPARDILESNATMDDSDEEDARDPFRYDSPLFAASWRSRAPASHLLR